MDLFFEQLPVVLGALNTGFIQTLKLFFVTLLGAFPLGLLIALGSMSKFKPLSYLMKFIVWIVRGTLPSCSPPSFLQSCLMVNRSIKKDIKARKK